MSFTHRKISAKHAISNPPASHEIARVVASLTSVLNRNKIAYYIDRAFLPSALD
jgi:hypothetical protein